MTAAMRAVLAVIMTLTLAGAFTGCSLLGSGGDRQVPEGDAWRTEVVTAIEETPGVTSSSVTVEDSDNGAGYEGPLLYGSIKVEEQDAQAVVDEAMRRVSDVLGKESDGVRLNVYVSVAGGPAEKLRQFGYDGVSDGTALWEATH